MSGLELPGQMGQAAHAAAQREAAIQQLVVETGRDIYAALVAAHIKEHGMNISQDTARLLAQKARQLSFYYPEAHGLVRVNEAVQEPQEGKSGS